MEHNTMIDPTITCPQCKSEIKLTESLAAPVIESTRQQYEKQIAEKESAVARREAALRKEEAALAKARETLQEQVAEKLKAERVSIAAEEAKKARLLLSNDLDQKAKELTELQEVLKHRDEKLAEAQKAQADLIRKQRELDDAKREMELTIETRVQQSLTATRAQAKLEAEEGLKLKVLEKEQTILAMQKQIEELRRKAEQGSQQLQGEVQELEMEAMLREKFPRDAVEAGSQGGAWRRFAAARLRAVAAIVWHDTLGIETNQELERRLAGEIARRPARGQGRVCRHRFAGASQGGRDLRSG